MKKIPLTQGKFALVDDEDFEWLNQYKWYAAKQSNIFYAWRKVGKYPNQKTIRMHRQIMNAPKNQDIDHINHNGLDNRKFNLRFCTDSQNQHNQLPYKNCSSTYKGVCWKKHDKKWCSQITKNDHKIYIGCFSNEIDAAKAYNAKARELFGKYACLNKIA